MSSKFYIDESGNTGDIIRYRDLSFAKQPLFSLACVEIKDIDKVESFVSDLVKKYKVQSSELKAKSIYKSKPKLILELCEFMESEGISFFVELVDKKFNICATIVNHHVFPPYFTGDESDGTAQYLRNVIADYMSQNMPEKYYFSFFDACFASTEKALLIAMNDLKDYFYKIKNNSEMQEVYSFVESSIDDYFIMKKMNKNNEEVIRNFLPVPDLNKRDSNIWLLPHVSSFSNLIARVNLYTNIGMSNLTLIHDKQDHFDEILEDIKKQTCNETEMKGMAELLYANYSIKNEPKLIFEDSSNSIGIQIADLLAGFSTRYYRELLYSSNEINDVYHHIRAVLFNSSEPENGTGINMVLPESVLKNDIISYTYGFKLINT